MSLYGNTLSRLCFSLCRNNHDASDLYQDTWLKAYTSYDINKINDFEKWLYAICVNRFKDIYRKKLRMPQEIQFETNDHKDAFMASIADIDTYNEDDYTELYNAIEQLPEKLRVVISLRYFSDMSCSEVSEVLGISVTAVTTRLSRAVKQLAKSMNAGKENMYEKV